MTQFKSGDCHDLTLSNLAMTVCLFSGSLKNKKTRVQQVAYPTLAHLTTEIKPVIASLDAVKAWQSSDYGERTLN